MRRLEAHSNGAYFAQLEWRWYIANKNYVNIVISVIGCFSSDSNSIKLSHYKYTVLFYCAITRKVSRTLEKITCTSQSQLPNFSRWTNEMEAYILLQIWFFHHLKLCLHIEQSLYSSQLRQLAVRGITAQAHEPLKNPAFIKKKAKPYGALCCRFRPAVIMFEVPYSSYYILLQYRSRLGLTDEVVRFIVNHQALKEMMERDGFYVESHGWDACDCFSRRN
uniref:AlNc14C198G8610 protein n=1 Tax=Albugo laibachii Nc14 TaxID=890382 RepID=F0WQE0_9STRA|nr:AlNc14C198G8610 [Albugo laibachii Nc14]|eukprot:CCA23548.1 AlNc14C198G8610 [Albugo laibachii Nc14]